SSAATARSSTSTPTAAPWPGSTTCTRAAMRAPRGAGSSTCSRWPASCSPRPACSCCSCTRASAARPGRWSAWACWSRCCWRCCSSTDRDIRSIPMRVTVSLVVGTLLAAPAAQAADLSVSVEIPRINASEYHRPYVAVWIEGADQKAAANLAVWYQQSEGKEGHRTTRLPDRRQWWRKGGRTLDVPVDGVTGPTRPVGKHALAFDERHPELAKLPAGKYT